MDRAKFISVKNEIASLIKKISDYYGGDDPEDLKVYIKEQIESYKDNLDYLHAATLSWYDQLEKSKKDGQIVFNVRKIRKIPSKIG